MLFNSFEYLLIFLPLTVTVYFFLNKQKLLHAGRGVVSDKQTPGFGSRIVDWVWPF